MFSDCLFAVWCSLKYKTQPVKRNGYHLSLQNGWNSIDMVWSGKYVGHQLDDHYRQPDRLICLHFGLDLSAGEVATVSTGLARGGADDLRDGLWEGFNIN